MILQPGRCDGGRGGNCNFLPIQENDFPGSTGPSVMRPIFFDEEVVPFVA